MRNVNNGSEWQQWQKKSRHTRYALRRYGGKNKFFFLQQSVQTYSHKFDMATVSNASFFAYKYFFFRIHCYKRKKAIATITLFHECLYHSQNKMERTMNSHVKKSNILITQIVDEDRLVPLYSFILYEKKMTHVIWIDVTNTWTDFCLPSSPSSSFHNIYVFAILIYTPAFMLTVSFFV